MSKKKIAVLGGGVGALTAAYYLTDKPGWQDEYDVTIYSLGWRLGGKGASSRDPDKNCRIEEHGLHVWFGFYENAFATLRQCYKELDRPAGSPLATINDAFTSRSDMSMLENHDGKWSIWPIPFPRKSSHPGVGPEDYEVWKVLDDVLGFLTRHLDDWLNSVESSKHHQPDVPAWAEPLLAKLVSKAEGKALHLAHKLVKHLPADLKKHEEKHHELIRSLLEDFRKWMWKEVEHLIDGQQFLRRLWEITDLVTTVIIGCFHDDVFNKGLRSLDDRDFRAWILSHGATQHTAESTPVRAMYDCMFCYHDGDLNRPDFAAGAALGSFIRIGLIYRGDVLYEMKAGMGDVVVMPLYQMLAKRGVKFEFFSKVKKLELDETGKRIKSIRIARQVEVKGDHYDPIGWCEPLKMYYWPPVPDYDQIVQGEALKTGKINLESHWAPWKDVGEYSVDLGPDDRVVLGIAKGGLDDIVTELCDANQNWRDMMEQLPSMQTQSMQLWMTQTTKIMGWQGVSPATMVAGPEPQDVWADMSHLLAIENWSAGNAPLSLQYMCGPFKGNWMDHPASDHTVPAQAEAQVREIAIQWLEKYAGALWPKSTEKGQGTALDWKLLFDPENNQGPDRIDSQWLRANIDPTERYVIAPAGANLTRIPSDDTGFVNLVLAGDWTRNPINSGCVEAAVMSAMAASRAVCGHPKRINGEHFLQS